MNIIRVKNYEEMSLRAAELLLKRLKDPETDVIGLATGGTPKGMYRELIRLSRENNVSFKNVHTVNLDEYVGLAHDDPNSYHTYMARYLFDHIDIPKENTHLPDGTAKDLERECARYEEMIKELREINVQLLGIGENGHIGFNEPGTPFHSRTQVIALAPSTREANARYFNSMDDVPTHAITMGIDTIMDSLEIVLLASGTNKAEALRALVDGDDVTEEVPATVLKNHPNLTVIADDDALSKVTSL
ncbi:glucosamine-6-phosphate deaminase [Alteribacter natronophilus]|uniref:glucosamine-6-phosphate deaminase n=1 Tax=Alteribacter natronophilus TaxID=2583810 RepID=UPI00110E36CB|nr:glucosamine-6-phosphate deaminase [Alteribacter natronophilus]TMW70941.1 glucosamine-6-phosphate deaminase [Alteribacter natronophilus]